MRTLIFLGTGTSVGVPMLGCTCEVCSSVNPRNQRTRCSVLIQLPRGNILIDTSPEMRLQLLREKIRKVHAVLYTHYHADHLFGLDDLRPLCKYLGEPMPIYCSQEVEEKIRTIFPYALVDDTAGPREGFIPQLRIQRIGEEAFSVLSHRITPIPLEHARFNVFGFRVEGLAYCTDVSRIPDRSWGALEGLDTLILDALRFKPHSAHFCLNEALDVIARLKPRRAFLTHMAHEIDHDSVSRQLPPGVQLAYDGLQVTF